MKKRILSLVLALLMLLSVLPTTALATDGDASETPTAGHTSVVSAESDDKAVHVIKSVDGDTLTLEAYATNTISKQTSYEPLDIVLVLDVSGSMAETITSNKYTPTTKDTWSCDDIYYARETYYYKDNVGNYYRVGLKDSGYGRGYRCWITAGGKQIGEKVKDWDEVSYRGELYTRQSEGTVNKIVALKNAVNTFITSVANQKDSEGNAIDNRISLVKFAGDKTDKIGNNTYDVTTGGWPFQETNTYNHTQIVKELTRVDEAGKTALTNAVNALKAMGATSADYGMELAKKELEKRTGDAAKRKSVVIMFTDGEPNHGSGFNGTVANSAIDRAKKLKDAGTLVYTIGMFTDANPADTTSKDINKYMHAVSSNYPKATAYTNLGDRAENSNYYLAASNAGDLDDVFQAISEDISSLKVKVDGSSVLSDTLSDMFDFAPIGDQTAKDCITVTKVPVTGKDADGNYTWGTAEPSDLTAEINGKTVTVKGFDYGDNAVTVRTDEQGNVTGYSGCKLVVTIPIKPDTGYTHWEAGTHNYPTNSVVKDNEKDEQAGLTYGEGANRSKVALDQSPEAPVTAYTVSYTYTGDVPSTVSGFEDGYYIAGQEATVKNEPDSPVTENGFTYTFGGWTSDEIRDGKISITDHNVTVTGNWTKEAVPPQTIDFTFKKVWEDAPAGRNYPSITVQLINKATGEVVKEQEFKMPAASCEFKNVPAGAEYTIKEVGVEGATLKAGTEAVFEIKDANGNVTGIWKSALGESTESGTGKVTPKITNSYEATTATVTITKEFVPPEGDTAFTAPNSLRIKLVPEDTSKNAIYLTRGPTYTSSNIPAGTYKVVEENAEVDDYTCNSTLKETGATEPLDDMIITVAAGGTYTYELTNTYTANPNPGLKVEKIVYKNELDDDGNFIQLGDTEQVKVGEMIIYEINVTNTGNTKLENITIEDEFKGKGTLTQIEESVYVPVETTNGKFTINAGDLEAGRSFTSRQYYYIVVTDDAKETKITNTAVAKADDETSDDDKSVVDVDPENFDLKVTKIWDYKNGDPEPNQIWSITAQLYADDEPLTGKTVTITNQSNNGGGYAEKITLPLWRTDEDGEYILDKDGKKERIEYSVEETGISFGEGDDKQELTKADGKDEFEVKDANNNLLGYWVATYPKGLVNELKIKNTFREFKPNAELTVTKKILKDGELVDTVRAKIGEDITYVVTITNSGNIPLSGLKLEENFSGGHGTLDGVYKDLNDDTTKIELDSNQEVELPGTLEPGKSVTYYLKYTVHADDTQVRNSVTVNPTAVTGFRPAPSDTVYVNVNRGDVDGYNVTGLVYKIVRSDKGTYNPDEDRQEFKFVIWKDEDCTEKLHNFPIYFTDTVKEGKEETKDGKFSFEISLDDYNDLGEEEIDGVTYKVVYLTELEGDDEKMTYSTTPIKLYIVRDSGEAQIAALFGLNIIGGEHGEITAVANPRTGEWANVTNIYNKKYEKPVKVGPQLNRDDHVAYIMGYPDGTVQPEGEITRAEACTIFFRLLTDSSRDYYFSKTNDYSDVNAGDWFNNAISTLSNAGIVTGYNDGTFRPNQPITRGEMAKIIANFANLKHGDKTFTDLAGHWSKSYVELAAGNGWIAGYPDGSFRPDQKITRAETVTMINRVLERVPAKQSRLLSRSIMLTFPDNNPGDWYYIAIQEASNSHEYQRSVYETTGDEMWTKLIDNVDWTKLEK